MADDNRTFNPKEHAGPPEEYESFKMPEGLIIDQTMLDKFLPIARELNLTQVQAQKLVDLYSEQVKLWSAELMKEREFWGKDFNDFEEKIVETNESQKNV